MVGRQPEMNLEIGRGMGRVINIRTGAPFDVFIGRPGKWGNPFIVGIDGTRAVCVRKYLEWVIENPHLMSHLLELRGKILGCYCKPKRCHGDVLLELTRNIRWSCE